MGRRVIDRAEWVDYVDAFSRRHDGWLISVAVDEASNARRYVARDVEEKREEPQPVEVG